MNATPFLVGRHLRAIRRWRAFPILGGQVDDFVLWLGSRGYADSTVSLYLSFMPRVECWLRSRGIKSFEQLTMHAVADAYCHFRSRHHYISSATRCLQLFLRERGSVPEGTTPPPLPGEIELDRFTEHLRRDRGLAANTVLAQTHQVRHFLAFLRFDAKNFQLSRLELERVEAFLHRKARTNSRLSMQHVVAAVRGFLRWEYTRGKLSRPLHRHIDGPRVYRLERLPKALPWSQVRALLDSIDRSTTRGLRDFSLLYLTAAYGLRSSELVRLTLDDFDWRKRILRVYQPKNKQVIPLPLTDEAAGVLIKYLRKARPVSRDRHLFLRFQAPAGSLAPAMVGDALERCRRASGLKLPPMGAHVLRHSFAVHLLRQGVAMKTIGDTLGHRDAGSTLVYLRLGIEDLREVSMPVPISTAIAKPSGSVVYRPRLRAAPFHRRLPKHFHSFLATDLQRFVQIKRTQGCAYRIEAVMLGRWDDFLHRRYPKSRQLRPEMFLNWTPELAHLTLNVQCAYLRVVRNFLQFHARDHTNTFIPDALNLPKTTPPPLPRLVLPDEMARVLEVAQRLPASTDNPLRAETFRLGLILLFCCGLRRNELLRLTLDHIDLEQSLIHIENTKFHKSRLVPLSPTVANEVAKYLRQRQQRKVSMNPKAFLLANGIHGTRHMLTTRS